MDRFIINGTACDFIIFKNRMLKQALVVLFGNNRRDDKTQLIDKTFSLERTVDLASALKQKLFDTEQRIKLVENQLQIKVIFAAENHLLRIAAELET